MNGGRPVTFGRDEQVERLGIKIDETAVPCGQLNELLAWAVVCGEDEGRKSEQGKERQEHGREEERDTWPRISGTVALALGRGGGLASYHHVSRPPPTIIPLSFLLFRPCRLALSHAIFRQHRHHVLSHSPTPGIHHRRASGRLGFHMVNTDVRYKYPLNSI